MDFLAQCFGWLCGQATDRSWIYGSEMFPLCQRCTGIYASAGIAFLFYFIRRKKFAPSWFNLILILQMVPAGLHWFSDTPLSRTLSGGWFGIGLVGILLNPFPKPDGNALSLDTLSALVLPLFVCLLAASGSLAAESILLVLGAMGGITVFGSIVWRFLHLMGHTSLRGAFVSLERKATSKLSS